MQLTDNLGRKFNYLRLSVTDQCNFRCNYCLPEGYQCESKIPPPLSLSEISTLVKSFAMLGTRKVRITGGEPALRKDLAEIIRVCKSTDGIQKVALTTNGYSLQRHVASWREAGLDALNVSVDSLDRKMFHTITGHDKLGQIIEGIEYALSLGFSTVKVNSVLLKSFNENQLAAFLAWVEQTPVTVRFIELMQTGDNQTFFRANHIAGADIALELEQQGWQPVISPADAGPAKEYRHSRYAGRIGLITPYSKDFCASCNRLRVSSQGKLHLCLFADAGFDLRQLLRTGDARAVATHIVHLMEQKLPSHALWQGWTGGTRHLAMLGG